MQQAVSTRTPAHLWIVGMLALFWSLFGAFDYFMTRTKGAEWMRNMLPGPDADRYMAYINDFPIWASIAFGSTFGITDFR